jgi:hypothetical protein
MKNKLLSIYLDIRSAFRKAIGSCWACGTPFWSEGYGGHELRFFCNHCDKPIKAK